MNAPLEIRSFRAVFALERRIYRIDTLRLNPGGVPLRGIVYALVMVLTALLAGALPPTSWLDALVPWYARDIAVPVALAVAFGALRLEGRPSHTAAAALVRHAIGARRLCGLRPVFEEPARWHPPPLLLIPDGSDARFRALRYRGPGVVRVQHPHLRAEWPRRAGVRLTLDPLEASAVRPSILELAGDAVLEVRRAR